MIEKRKNKRLPRGEKTYLDNECENKEIVLLDISMGGMKLLTNEEYKTGAPLGLKVNILPKSGAFFVKGRVVWIKPSIVTTALFEVGVKFTKISTITI
jgi:Tfp pilus assembly protein PilZ